MRESTIEAKGCRDLLLLFGIVSVKVGHDGWPDRLCLCGAGQHFWIEWKAPGGKLEPAQKVRINELFMMGEHVYVCQSQAEAVLAAESFLAHRDAPSRAYRHGLPAPAERPVSVPGGRGRKARRA